MNAGTDLLETAARYFHRSRDTATDDHALEQWLAADPSHREAYAQVCAAWYALEESPEPLARMAPARGRRRWAWLVFPICAVLVAYAFVPVASVPGSPWREVDFRASADVHIDAGAGRTASLQRGRAWFSVPDGAASIFIEVDGWQVTDLGTRFSVDADQQRVVVFDGSVRVSRIGDPAQVYTVEQGDALDLTQGTRTPATALDLALDREQWLFLDINLGQALAEIEREGADVALLGVDRSQPLPRIVLPDRRTDTAIAALCSQLSLHCWNLGRYGYLLWG